MKTAVMIGRFQPITNAHYNIIKDAIDKYSQTCCCIIDSFIFLQAVV